MPSPLEAASPARWRAAAAESPQHIQAAAAPIPSEGDTPPASKTKEKEGHRKAITLDPNLWQDVPALEPVLDALLASMAFDLHPTDTPLKSAEDWVAELLGSQPVCLHSAKRTAVAAQLEGARSALTGLAEKDPELNATITARVQSLAAELESLDKKLPSQRKFAASIATAKKEFEDKHQTAMETCQRAKAAHLERWTGRRLLTQRVREIMDVLDAEMEKEEIHYEDAHERRNAQRDSIAAQVHEILDARLLLVETTAEDAQEGTLASTMGTPHQNAGDGVEAAKTAAATAAASLAQLQQKHDEHLRQQRQDQLNMEKMKQRMAAAQEFHASLALFHKRSPNLTELAPLVPPPDVEAVRPALTHL